MSSKQISVIRKNLPEVLFLIAAFLFSFWLMTKTFGYDHQKSTILVASKAWSDFAAHIPLIRSFSFGSNFPPEYPLFPGEPIRYHYLFYALAGLLEKIGLPLDWALNLPSILGFWFLLIMIYLLAKLLFQKKSVAFLSVIFFVFNGSLSFLEFFRQNPLSLNTPKEIINNLHFPSFGPYDGKVVSAFWNWNIFTNQRHLAPSYFLVLLIIYLLLKATKRKKKLKTSSMLSIIIIVGFLPSFHKAIFIVISLILFSFFLYFSQLRKEIFIILFFSTLLALPQLFPLLQSGTPSLGWRPGYLVEHPLSFTKIFSYWFFNLGLSLLLIPLGFFFADKTTKKLFLSILPLFIIGNLFQFSPEIAANHKFFNLFLILANIYAAFTISKIWQSHFFGKLALPFLIFFLTFSGVIDAFAIKNDPLYTLNDAPKDPDVQWIKENTSSESVFLNSSFLYHPASLAGRKIFLGWPYFSWSAGYDTNKRDLLRIKLLETDDFFFFCQETKYNHIDYLIINTKEKNEEIAINQNFFDTRFSNVYYNSQNGIKIYQIINYCP